MKPIPDKMTAAVLLEPQKLVIQDDFPVPEPESDEVLVEIAANGLCHTDVTYYDAKIPEKMRMYPLILGHEAAGKVVKLGKEVENISLGEHVLLPPVYGCGECSYCQAGLDNLCLTSSMLGGNRHGTYAQYTAMPSRAVFPINRSTALDCICTAADAVSTVFYVLTERVLMKEGEIVVVFGCGGLGLAALSTAKALGASRLIAIDNRDIALEAAAKLGAEIINIDKEAKVHKTLKGMTDDSVRIALDCVGHKSTIEAAFKSIARGGEVAVIGYTMDTVELVAGGFMGQQKRVGGSWGCPTRLFPSMIKMIDDGGIDFSILIGKRYELPEIGQAFEDLETGKIVGRGVITISH